MAVAACECKKKTRSRTALHSLYVIREANVKGGLHGG